MDAFNRAKPAVAAAILSIALSSPLAAEALDLELHVAVSSIEKAAAPRIYGDFAIFTSGFKARSVGLSFQHEDWRSVHPMERNRNGVYFLVYRLPLDAEEPLRYRMVVDGAWIRDPLNPEIGYEASTGSSLSVLAFPRVSSEKPGLYRILDGRKATFVYRAAPGERICLAGTFNDWDPFMYPMDEPEPGLYRLSLVLPPGIQRYAFVENGRTVHDPLNPQDAYSQDGRHVSVLTVP